MSGPVGVKSKFVPHKTMEEGWTYVSVPDDNIVIGVRVSVTKVMKLLNPDGSQQRDAAGNPAYWFQSANVVKVLTPEEYRVIQQMGLKE